MALLAWIFKRKLEKPRAPEPRPQPHPGMFSRNKNVASLQRTAVGQYDRIRLLEDRVTWLEGALIALEEKVGLPENAYLNEETGLADSDGNWRVASESQGGIQQPRAQTESATKPAMESETEPAMESAMEPAMEPAIEPEAEPDEETTH